MAIAVMVLGSTAWAAQKPVSQAAAVSKTFTIEAIDYKSRLITLKDAGGLQESMLVGPEVKRFNELKVGDKVTFRYYESLVYAIRKPGQPAPSASSVPTMVPGKGERPGGTLSQQITASVVLTAIDPKVPSVTVRTDEGRTMSFRVEDAKNLAGLKVGDRVDVTYTEALAISVESPK
jgi:Cu/Ag efflux protein CusF